MGLFLQDGVNKDGHLDYGEFVAIYIQCSLDLFILL